MSYGYAIVYTGTVFTGKRTVCITESEQNTTMNNKKKPETIDLDNSGVYYAATRSANRNQVFRVSAVLKEKVDPRTLSTAIGDMKARFPTFFVHLKTGAIHYKLQTAEDTGVLSRESDHPCRPFHIGRGFRDKPMFRVLYFENRLSIEFFHILTDGGGAVGFLKNLLARYFELRGIPVEKTHGVLGLDEEPKPSETEDSFKRFIDWKQEKLPRREASAYQYKPAAKEDFLRVVHGLVSVEELKQITKAENVTITEYLTAVYIHSFYRNMLPVKSKKPIKVSVPADLRRLFDSSTLRNFSLYATVGIFPREREYSFEEILAEVSAKIRSGLSKGTLLRSAYKNASEGNLVAFRFAPVFLKKVSLKAGAAVFGERLFTTSLSNLGIVSVPKGMEEHIQHFEFVIGETLKNGINCSAITFGDLLNITFSSAGEETDIQRLFFTFLSSRGLNVRIQSNI